MNKSGLRPLGRAVLVKPYVPERSGSVIALPDFVEAQSSSLEQRAFLSALSSPSEPTRPLRSADAT